MSASERRVRKARVHRVARPNSREAVRLELDPHRPALGALVLRAAEDAEQVLDVVAVLVGDDVRLGERPALRAEARAQLVEEAQVDVDVLIGRAIEGPHGRGGSAAAALHGVGEEARARRDVVAAAAGERVRPVALDRVDVADDATVLAHVRVGAGLTLLGDVAIHRRRPRRLALEVPELAQAAVAPGDVAAEEDDEERDDEADAAAADREAALADPAAAEILDLRGVELRVVTKVRHLGAESFRRAPGPRLSRPRTARRSSPWSAGRRRPRPGGPRRSRPRPPTPPAWPTA